MENISLESLLRQYITNSINGLFTSMPGRIERVVSLPEQRVDVQLLVDRVRPEGDTLKHPVILNVPIVFPGSKTSQLTFPVVPGDIVLCVFSQRSLDRFKLGAETNHTPTDFRKYSRADAMAIPGLFPFNQARNNPNKRSLPHDPNDTVVAHNLNSSQENEVRLKSDGSIEVNAAADTNISFHINGIRVLMLESSGANFDVPVTAPNFTTDIGVSVNDHTHSQGNDSDNNSQTETDPPTV